MNANRSNRFETTLRINIIASGIMFNLNSRQTLVVLLLCVILTQLTFQQEHKLDSFARPNVSVLTAFPFCYLVRLCY